MPVGGVVSYGSVNCKNCKISCFTRKKILLHREESELPCVRRDGTVVADILFRVVRETLSLHRVIYDHQVKAVEHNVSLLGKLSKNFLEENQNGL